MREKVNEQEIVFRFCLDNTTTTPPPDAKAATNVPTSAYLAPFLVGNVKDEVDVMAKGCMRWNTDK